MSIPLTGRIAGSVRAGAVVVGSGRRVCESGREEGEWAECWDCTSFDQRPVAASAMNHFECFGSSQSFASGLFFVFCSQSAFVLRITLFCFSELYILWHLICSFRSHWSSRLLTTIIIKNWRMGWYMLGQENASKKRIA